MIRVHELEIRLVDQRGRPQRRIAVPLATLSVSNRAKLVVDDWKKCFEGGAVTVLEISEQVGDGPGFCLAGVTHYVDIPGIEPIPRQPVYGEVQRSWATILSPTGIPGNCSG